MNKFDSKRNSYQLKGSLGNHGYDWWWHSFTGYHHETGEERSFFIEYFIINPAKGVDIPILGQIPNRTDPIKPSYIMIKVGTWGKDAKQVHRFFPINKLQIDSKILKMQVEDCFLSETSMSGSVEMTEDDIVNHPEYMSNVGKMTWDLKIDKIIPYHVGYGASWFFRKIQAFAMYWHVEGMKTNYQGTVTLDNEVYNVSSSTSYGYADKNWGKDFTSPWVWLSSCNIRSTITNEVLHHSAFDIGGGCPKVFGISLKRKLLIDFVYEGKEYEFNFSKFWKRNKTQFECKETEEDIIWEIVTQNQTSKLVLTCTCKKSDMLLINYESPDGFKRFSRLWNGGNGIGHASLYEKRKGKEILIDDFVFENAGCEYGEYDLVNK